MTTVVSPKAATVNELVESLEIDDSSLARIADALKSHPVNHAVWIGYERMCRQQLAEVDMQMDEVTGRLVGLYEKEAKSAAAVQNYAKHEMKLHPEYKAVAARQRWLQDQIRFCEEVSRCFTKRADLLIALTKLDASVIVNEHKGAQSARVDARQATIRFNKIVNALHQPWGNSLI